MYNIIYVAFKARSKVCIDFFLEVQPFGFINLSTYIALQKLLYFFPFCFIEMGNLTVLQTITIPLCINPAPFWVNLYLSEYESDFCFIGNKTPSPSTVNCFVSLSWLFKFLLRACQASFHSNIPSSTFYGSVISKIVLQY